MAGGYGPWGPGCFGGGYPAGCGGGYGGGGYGGAGGRYGGSSFVLIVVLFILLIIVGRSFV